MASRFLIVICTLILMSQFGCKQTNPLVGTWETEAGAICSFMGRRIEITEQVIKGPLGAGAYTLKRDGPNLFIDTHEPGKGLITVLSVDGQTMTWQLTLGFTCNFRRVK
jgi:hypothetical protein